MATKKKAVWEWKIVRGAIWDALLKLNPRKMMGNPVMFVVEIGSVITTVLLFKGGTASKFNLQITLWLWFTVVFANFAEAMAEGRARRRLTPCARRALKRSPTGCWRTGRSRRFPVRSYALET